MGLKWFNISMETPVREIGWAYLTILIGVSFIIKMSVRLWKDGFRTRTPFNQCGHFHTRCLHGDEIMARLKVYVIRFWKTDELPRQLCLDCGDSLNRQAICTATGLNQHEWNGSWPFSRE